MYHEKQGGLSELILIALVTGIIMYAMYTAFAIFSPNMYMATFEDGSQAFYHFYECEAFTNSVKCSKFLQEPIVFVEPKIISFERLVRID